MAISRQQKEEILKQISEYMKSAKSVIFADFHGLSVEDSQKVRTTLRNHGVKTKIAKKTLIIRAGKKNGYEIDKSFLDGQIAMAFSMEDEVVAAQDLYKLGKKNEHIKLVGGIFDGKVASKDLVMKVAQIPPKEELLAKLVGSMRAPLAAFRGVMHNTISGFVQVCKQIVEKEQA